MARCMASCEQTGSDCACQNWPNRHSVGGKFEKRLVTGGNRGLYWGRIAEKYRFLRGLSCGPLPECSRLYQSPERG